MHTYGYQYCDIHKEVRTVGSTWTGYHDERRDVHDIEGAWVDGWEWCGYIHLHPSEREELSNRGLGLTVKADIWRYYAVAVEFIAPYWNSAGGKVDLREQPPDYLRNIWLWLHRSRCMIIGADSRSFGDDGNLRQYKKRRSVVTWSELRHEFGYLDDALLPYDLWLAWFELNVPEIIRRYEEDHPPAPKGMVDLRGVQDLR